MVDQAERKKYCTRKDITLNGRPAKLTGWRDGAATLTAGTDVIRPTWETVARIVQRKNGAFTS